MIEREFDRHTSLIVDPPDGRIPPLTARHNAGVNRPRTPRGANIPKTSTMRSAASHGACPGSADDMGPATTGTTRSCRRLDTWSCTWRPATRRASFRWTGARTFREASTLERRLARPVGRADARHRDDQFSPRSNFLGSAAGLQLVERLTRVAPDTIRYEMTMSDPATWTQPWTAEMPLKRSTEKLYEWACHEGNFHIMTGMLSAARAQEQRDGGPEAVRFLTARAKPCTRQSTRDPPS